LSGAPNYEKCVQRAKKFPSPNSEARYDPHKKREERLIFTSARPSAAPDSFETGSVPGSGTFFCAECGGSHLSLMENEPLPECPDCGGTSFRRDSIFEPMQEHCEATSEFSARPDGGPPAWLHEARTLLPGSGRYLACLEDDDRIRLFAIERGWTRIGRSAVADVRLDDPSVSRRHALIVSEKPDSLRVLDDRSLNGVQLNGEQVEWGRLADGDELAIGRYRLFTLEA
jgi:FHA domain-containing protein/zinc ribbon family protein